MNRMTREYEESQKYHRIMGLLQDLKLDHGKCHPREDHACTHCNAEEEIEKMLKEYRGPRIVAS